MSNLRWFTQSPPIELRDRPISISSCTNAQSAGASDFDAVGSAGQEVFRPYYTGVLADMCRAAGRLDEG
jgi:hypothetical protein